MKIDKKPLLSEGFKEISLYQLDQYFLDPFSNKEVRLKLITKLRDYLEMFQSLGLSAEVWLDGSFTTTKEEPEDVDVAFVLNVNEVNALEGTKRVLFSRLFYHRTEVKLRYMLDVHYFDGADEEQRAFYLKLFGLERDNFNKKGIFKFRL